MNEIKLKDIINYAKIHKALKKERKEFTRKYIKIYCPIRFEKYTEILTKLGFEFRTEFDEDSAWIIV